MDCETLCKAFGSLHAAALVETRLAASPSYRLFCLRYLVALPDLVSDPLLFHFPCCVVYLATTFA